MFRRRQPPAEPPRRRRRERRPRPRSLFARFLMLLGLGTLVFLVLRFLLIPLLVMIQSVLTGA